MHSHQPLAQRATRLNLVRHILQAPQLKDYSTSLRLYQPATGRAVQVVKSITLESFLNTWKKTSTFPAKIEMLNVGKGHFLTCMPTLAVRVMCCSLALEQIGVDPNLQLDQEPAKGSQEQD